ncbi:MAG: DUF935 family protein [Ignavibacteria bacterium]|nr:DUF935 family protein [Ignavibacteria bacterium]
MNFKEGVTKLLWSLQIEDGDPNGEEMKDILATMLEQRNGGYARIIGDILDARSYGYQPMEVYWKRDGKRVIPYDLVGKPQTWFNFSEENELLMRTKDTPNGVAVPAYKFLVPTYDGSFTNPYGLGILATCFWPVTFKKGGLRFFVTYVEKYGMPWMVGKHDYSDTKFIDAFRDQLENLVQDGVAIIKKEEEEIDYLDASSAGSSEVYGTLRQQMIDEINLAVLGHESATQSVPGQLGNEDSAEGIRSDIIAAGSRLVEQTMSTLIAWTYQLNGWTAPKLPTFVLKPEEDINLERANRDTILNGQGVEFTESYYEKTYNLVAGEDFTLGKPKKEEPFAVAEPVEGADKDKGAKGGIGGKDGAGVTGDGKAGIGTEEDGAEEFAETGGMPPDQHAVDALDALISKTYAGQAHLDASMKIVLDYVQNAETYQDCVDRLGELYGEMNVDELEDMFHRAIALASAMGRSAEA